MTYLPTLWQAERAANRLTVAGSLWVGRAACRTRGGARSSRFSAARRLHGRWRRAQQPTMPVVGFLDATSPSGAEGRVRSFAPQPEA